MKKIVIVGVEVDDLEVGDVPQDERDVGAESARADKTPFGGRALASYVAKYGPVKGPQILRALQQKSSASAKLARLKK